MAVGLALRHAIHPVPAPSDARGYLVLPTEGEIAGRTCADLRVVRRLSAVAPPAMALQAAEPPPGASGARECARPVSKRARPSATNSTAYQRTAVQGGPATLNTTCLGWATIEVVRFFSHYQTPPIARLAASLSMLPCPVVLIWSDADPWCPMRTARELLEGIPRARLVVAERAGHFIMEERPELVVDALVELLHEPSRLGGEAALVSGTLG
jgi:pimeloyl-ACP methyl ester carboxylesterase